MEDRLLHPVDVVRVDEKGAFQFVGCPGEFAEDEHAVVIEAARHILLGHEVHAIPEGRDQHHIGGQVERHHLLARETVMLVADRYMRDRSVVAVDAADRQLDLVAERHVGLHSFAAGVGDLHEDYILGTQSALGEQLAERGEPVGDALRVVETVDAEHHSARVSEFDADLLCPLLHRGSARELLETVAVDRDGEGPGGHRAKRPLAGDLAEHPDSR